MLCVTSADESPSATEKRLRAAPDLLHEVRLDLSARPRSHLALIRRWAGRVETLVTCRPEWEGGGWTGSEEARAVLLAEALEAGARFVDLELQAVSRPGPVQRLFRRSPRERIVVSAHLWRGSASRDKILETAAGLSRSAGGAVKLAAWIEDTVELAWLLEAGRLLEGRRKVLVPMGPAGRIGRIRYRELGSAWTYVAYSRATAPGQVSLDEAHRLLVGEPVALFVILGGQAALASPGPRAYGRWFAERGIRAQYLSAPTADPLGTLELLAAHFRLRGASVTMPHKRAVLAAADRIHPTARRLGAANTLGALAGDGDHARWLAANTDVHGVRTALRPGGVQGGGRAVVFGAGGAASAAVAALQDLGARVRVVARRTEQSEALARRHGVAWASLASLASMGTVDVFVNATPLGRSGEDVLERPSLLEGAAVLDMVLSARQTGLERQARRAGARFVARGVDMWVAQGRAQMQLWLRDSPEAEWLRRAALEALAQEESRGQ